MAGWLVHVDKQQQALVWLCMSLSARARLRVRKKHDRKKIRAFLLGRSLGAHVREGLGPAAHGASVGAHAGLNTIKGTCVCVYSKQACMWGNAAAGRGKAGGQSGRGVG